MKKIIASATNGNDSSKTTLAYAFSIAAWYSASAHYFCSLTTKQDLSDTVLFRLVLRC